MESTSEEWRPVVGFEGFYEVSNLGRVKRTAGGQGAATVIQGVTKGFTKESTFDAYFDGPSAEIRYNNNRLLYTDISLRAIGGYIERLRRPYGES